MADTSTPRRVTVMGLGLFGGGAGAARHFAARGDSVTVTDLRDAATLRAAVDSLAPHRVRLVLGVHREEDFTSCDVLVVNPGVRPHNVYVEIARAHGAHVTTEFELGLEQAAERGARILAVTGSNGKSTTAAMLASIAGAAEAATRCGGNLGGSLLECTADIARGAPLVLEVSSFQLFRLNAFPSLEVAVVTNLAPNHLDWHGSLDEYYGAKRRLAELLPAGGRLVLNDADPELRRWPGQTARAALWFSGRPSPLADGTWVSGTDIVSSLGGSPHVVSSIDGIAVRGRHDLENCAAAVCAAEAFGFSPEAMRAGLLAYRPLAHRLEEVAAAAGIRFVDDSSATTPESSIVALESIEGPVAVIAGGSDKGTAYDGFADALAERATGVVLMGDAGDRIATALGARHPHAAVVVEYATSFEDSFEKAVGFLHDGGTVLLSPAAASFNAFANYRQRGDAFARLARAWASEMIGRRRG